MVTCRGAGRGFDDDYGFGAGGEIVHCHAFRFRAGSRSIAEGAEFRAVNKVVEQMAELLEHVAERRLGARDPDDVLLRKRIDAR